MYFMYLTVALLHVTFPQYKQTYNKRSQPSVKLGPGCCIRKTPHSQ